jgi:hypothetical protein
MGCSNSSKVQSVINAARSLMLPLLPGLHQRHPAFGGVP